MISLKNNFYLFIFIILSGCAQKNSLIIFEELKKDNEQVYRLERLRCNKNKQIEIWFKEKTSVFTGGAFPAYDTTDLNTITKKIRNILPKKKYEIYPDIIFEYITKNGNCISCLSISAYSEEKKSMIYKGYVAFINDSISDIKILDYYEKKDKVKKPSTISILTHRKKGIFIETDYFTDCITDENSRVRLSEQLIGTHLKSTIWQIDEETGKFIFLGNVKGTVNVPKGLLPKQNMP